MAQALITLLTALITIVRIKIVVAVRYLESVMQDVKDGKAHFAEHDLIEVD